MGNKEIRSDIEKNRLYLRFEGFFTEEEAKITAEEVIRETDKLSPGFVVISDINDYSPTTPAAAEYIQKAQHAFLNKKIKRLIRIAAPGVMGKIQFDIRARELGIAQENVTSLEEAEALAAKLEK